MFCIKKGNVIPQLSDLGFAVDEIALMNEFNVKLQCKDLLVHEMCNAVKAFMRRKPHYQLITSTGTHPC